MLLRLPLCLHPCRFGVVTSGGLLGCTFIAALDLALWSLGPEVGGLLGCVCIAVLRVVLWISVAEICGWTGCTCVVLLFLALRGSVTDISGVVVLCVI